MEPSKKRLGIVTKDQSTVDDILEEIHQMRREQELWDAVKLGMGAGLGALLGAMAMACK